jgi:hypothetical protein
MQGNVVGTAHRQQVAVEFVAEAVVGAVMEIAALQRPRLRAHDTARPRPGRSELFVVPKPPALVPPLGADVGGVTRASRNPACRPACARTDAPHQPDAGFIWPQKANGCRSLDPLLCAASAMCAGGSGRFGRAVGRRPDGFLERRASLP